MASYDLVSLPVARQELQISNDSANDELIREIIERVTEWIEAETGREIVSRNYSTPAEEVHQIDQPQAFLYTRNRPLKAVPTLLTINGTVMPMTGLVVELNTGRILGVGGLRKGHPLLPPVSAFGPDYPEDYNFRYGMAYAGVVGTIKVSYIGGYESTAAVPGRVQALALNAIAHVYRDVMRKSQGISSISDTTGSISKITTGALAKASDLREALNSERTYSKTGLGNAVVVA